MHELRTVTANADGEHAVRVNGRLCCASDDPRFMCADCRAAVEKKHESLESKYGRVLAGSWRDHFKPVNDVPEPPKLEEVLRRAKGGAPRSAATGDQNEVPEPPDMAEYIRKTRGGE